jgi:hypothetical protein
MHQAGRVDLDGGHVNGGAASAERHLDAIAGAVVTWKERGRNEEKER